MTDVKSKIQRSLLAKMLVGGLGTVLLLGVAWYGVGRALGEHENDMVDLVHTALETETAVLTVRRHEKDVLIRDLRSPEFFASGDSKNLRKHARALDRLHRDTTKLKSWREQLGSERGDLDKAVLEYETAFSDLIAAYRELGFGDAGLLGRLGKLQHDVDQLITEGDHVDLLRSAIALEEATTQFRIHGDEESGRALRAGLDAMAAKAKTAAKQDGLLIEKLDAYGETLVACIALHARIGLSEELGLRGAMRTAIHSIAPIIDKTRSKAESLAVAAHDRTQFVSIVLLLVGLLAAGVVFVLYARSVTRPVARLRDAAQAIGAGKLDTVVDVTSDDEIGELASAFGTMAANLSKSESERTEIFSGITETSSRLAAASSEILAATTQQSAGSEEQAAAVSQTVATIDEVLHAAEEGAARATEVTEASRRSVENSRAGTQSVESTIERMRKVKERSEELSASILELDGRAESIGVIIATVNDIAEQTNLLALNAAIEASRAGEHGKGFAVVAAEVRALADECKKATSQVRDILGEVQRATRLAVTRTRESVEGANEAMNAAEQTGDAIQNMEEALSGQSQAAAQINASARQQAIGIKQINEAMRSIDQVTRQNVDSNRQTQRAMEDLSVMGDRLRDLVSVNGKGS